MRETPSTIELRIRRQDGPDTAPYWETFVLPHAADHNVVSVLMVLREHPLTHDGRRVDPVCWDHNCMEEVCGSCAMLINGVPRPACSALIDQLEQPIVLEPLPKFPVVRDLLVDRSAIDAGLRKVHAWIEIDGAWDTHEPPPRIAPQQWAADYLYSRCMSCGCCMAACPQFGAGADFVGPAPLAQVRLMNAHPTGRHDKTERLHAIMAEGGLSDCGNAQNCVRVCPKAIPLTTAIGELGRQTTIQALKDLFGSS
ncbi:succinate dehydrogenase iron-sulfur subunit [Marichromatium gracile]|uniref:succinate dehydrogenase iron-sulfur subunit n=1 Tax=Marichromatium gracile TaxID=1048 RepID=UPI001F193853|nr:succinate dehydrogenase iron-sulfur subunit [Marichromatium gracile]MCF1183860.1 succinate dehydrogenase iron-sulfur subunit [Marichromatium gracile]